MKRVLDSSLDYPGRDGLYYHDGRPFTGIAYALFPSGELEFETEYRDGAEWGLHRKYSKEGAIIEEGNYRAGFREGLWRAWDASGKLALEEFREFGCPLTRKRWDAQGNLVEDFSLKESDPAFATLKVYRKIYGKSGYRAGSKNSADPNG